mgnify:CR=1 FL=1
MSDINFNDMNSMHYDILKEIGNIGAGNATTALAQMIDSKVNMNVPKVELLEFKELAELIGGAENIVLGVLFTLDGEIDGMMMFMLDLPSARHLVDVLLGNQPEYRSKVDEDFTEMEVSALEEIGNIIAGAYLSSLSTLTNLKINSSIPYMSIDMAGALLSVPAIEFGKVGDRALLIETEFRDRIKLVRGFFILIPSIDSYSSILSSLGL